MENNASYAQVFIAILSRCHFWHPAISLKSTPMDHSEWSGYLCSKTVCTTAHILVPEGCPSVGKIHLLP